LVEGGGQKFRPAAKVNVARANTHNPLSDNALQTNVVASSSAHEQLAVGKAVGDFIP